MVGIIASRRGVLLRQAGKRDLRGLGDVVVSVPAAGALAEMAGDTFEENATLLGRHQLGGLPPRRRASWDPATTRHTCMKDWTASRSARMSAIGGKADMPFCSANVRL